MVADVIGHVRIRPRLNKEYEMCHRKNNTFIRLDALEMKLNFKSSTEMKVQPTNSLEKRVQPRANLNY